MFVKRSRVSFSALFTASELVSRECREAARVQAPKSNKQEVGRLCAST
jgi:hypothetical protein